MPSGLPDQCNIVVKYSCVSYKQDILPAAFAFTVLVTVFAMDGETEATLLHAVGAFGYIAILLQLQVIMSEVYGGRRVGPNIKIVLEWRVCKHIELRKSILAIIHQTPSHLSMMESA